MSTETETLDEAWAAVEAVSGWTLNGVERHADGGWVAIAHWPYRPRAKTESGRGPTPAAALRELAARLPATPAYRRVAVMTTETSRPPLEALDVAVGRAVHDLTTSIAHKLATPTTLDEDCAVFGQAIVGRIASLVVPLPLRASELAEDLMASLDCPDVYGHRDDIIAWFATLASKVRLEPHDPELEAALAPLYEAAP